MKIVVEIQIGSDAMQTGEDVALALDSVSEVLTDEFGAAPLTNYYLDRYIKTKVIKDTNGKTVGEWRVEA